MNKPQINFTPLIDVLLVLLIIFMVVAPIKPSSFRARIPEEPKNIKGAKDHPDTLVVAINADLTLKLNERSVGTANETTVLITSLKNIFEARIANGDISESFADDPDRPTPDHIERTVFIKAPQRLDYGSMALIVDAVKLAGAYPISLQIDDLY